MPISSGRSWHLSERELREDHERLVRELDALRGNQKKWQSQQLLFLLATVLSITMALVAMWYVYHLRSAGPVFEPVDPAAPL